VSIDQSRVGRRGYRFYDQAQRAMRVHRSEPRRPTRRAHSRELSAQDEVSIDQSRVGRRGADQQSSRAAA